MTQKTFKTVETHRGYNITYWQKPIPDRNQDYDWCHADYDGPGDNRCGSAASVQDCKDAIDAHITENDEIVMGTDVIANGQWMQIEQVDGSHYCATDQEGESHWIADSDIDHIY